ncbi:MAG: HAD-IB family phosphatase [Planctomycetes bacterium]|nr:HAD-IB family phosphatase [Planctomycetota bacterium]
MIDAAPDAPPPYRTVVFDCDSTLSAIEGIDELAGARRAEIAALTERAMAGESKLEDVYGLRLARLRPSRDAIEALGRQYAARAVPEARELCAALTALGKRVVIVSGGIRAAVLALARSFAIDERDVFAVEIFHDAAGAYTGFDERSPLATHDGKRALVERLAAESECDPRVPGARGLGVVCVGDGMTDLVGARAARRFVAYGGVVRRESVFALARSQSAAPTFAALLPLLVDADELATLRTLPDHRRLLAVFDSLDPRGS